MASTAERYGIKKQKFGFECLICGTVVFEAEDERAAIWRLPVLVCAHERSEGHKIDEPARS